jgi:hypothetical protein
MNPYLEQDDAWGDFHGRFLIACAEAIGAQLVPNYIVKIEEYVFVHDLAEGTRRLLGRADLSVGVAGPDGGRASAAAGVIEAPAQVELPEVGEERQHFIEVRDRRSRDLVAVVELLSPADKLRGPDREQYLAKRAKTLNGPAHLVEIDLLRLGPPMPAEDRPACDYSAMVSRVEERPRAGFWPVRLRDRLPVIPIPVRSPDPDARLDLQEVLHRVYDAAGYHYYIYDGTPEPPLSKDDELWAKGFVPATS